MGLDLALAAVVLLAAVRGWFKGFISQAVGLSALAACVYIASPMRDAARPYARQYLPSMQDDILDRLLWWSSAVIAFIACTGVGNYLVRFRRRQPYGISEPNRANQGAGFVFGALKGAIIASFIAAGFAQFAPKYIPEDGAVANQAKASMSLAWNARYQPAERIWNSVPVRSFIAHVRANGLGDTAEAAEDAKQPETQSTAQTPPANAESHVSPPKAERDEPVKTARRGPTLSVPREKPLDPQSPTFFDDVARDMKRLGIGASKSR